MTTPAIILILILAIPVITLLGVFSYFELPLSITDVTQPELIGFIFMVLKEIAFWKIALITILLMFAFSTIKSWSKTLFYIVLAGILFYFYQLLYVSGQNAPLNSFNYQIYSGENCFYDDGVEKYIALDTGSKEIRLIPLNPEDNSFTPGKFIIRDISNVDCEFTTEKLLLNKK